MAARRGLPPLEHLLCSRGPKGRVVVANDTFDAVLELEVRQERISQALRGDFLDTGDPPLLGPLTPRRHERLVELMGTSLHHCDHIADIAVNTHAGGPGARAAQIEYIGSLAADELAALFYVVDMAGFAFVRARRYEAEDPSVWEKITVFEECLLRHGSWFLWAHIRGGQENNTDQMIEAGLRELVDWETGKEGMSPGLRMSLVDAYRHRLKKADDDVADVESSLRERLRRQVMAPQIGNLAENSTDR
ncbi:uncharacterized protein PG998_000879 [Apiospora kogelbergensis]|uniref:uncharacterized protein n=1 Tax=Apiospora kogelbergensis TaxID=1337665 RepID=UPI00312EBD0D